MKYFVNENCIGCGMCEGVCPNVFHMTDNGTAEAITVEVTESDLSAAVDAMDGCPVGAIEEQ